MGFPIVYATASRGWMGDWVHLTRPSRASLAGRAASQGRSAGTPSTFQAPLARTEYAGRHARKPSWADVIGVTRAGSAPMARAMASANVNHEHDPLFVR